eukprot:m.43688 g.43688  ORF g.43688 m.43688 type:complete len:79 (-) comp15062_c0_seq3:942-1178(-)
MASDLVVVARAGDLLPLCHTYTRHLVPFTIVRRGSECRTANISAQAITGHSPTLRIARIRVFAPLEQPSESQYHDHGT